MMEVKKYNQEELNEVIRLHELWQEGSPEGLRANLSDADLSGANLSDADLSGANLSNADLRGADLRFANLSNADLRGVDLSHTDLSNTDLSGANLNGADLRFANLSNADLMGANLSGADLHSVVGDGNRIKTVQTKEYFINFYDDRIQIACKNYSQKEWFDFSDEQISEMDEGALDWWDKHKPIIKSLCELYNE